MVRLATDFVTDLTDEFVVEFVGWVERSATQHERLHWELRNPVF